MRNPGEASLSVAGALWFCKSLQREPLCVCTCMSVAFQGTELPVTFVEPRVSSLS